MKYLYVTICIVLLIEITVAQHHLITRVDSSGVFSFDNVVFVIDTTNNVTVPAGWEYILVIKDGECWTADSSKTNRSISQPQFRRKFH